MFSSSENMFPCPPSRPSSIMERKWKPNVELAPNCPRCDSSNTKFCYYNNYSLSQPRYFCKGCRRYWTKGGSLRNVPVGGGCRKNRRGKSIRVSTDHRGVNVSGSTYGGFMPGGDVSDTIGDDPLESLGVSGENCVARSTGESGQDASGIDLAAVYAKFLNQRSDVDSGVASGEFSVSPMELSNASNRNQSPPPTVEFSQDHNLVECQRPVDLMREAQLSDSHQMYLGEFDLNCKEKDRIGQYTSTAESSDFGFESLSSEGALQDIFWSNNYQIPSNYTPQSLHQPHGFEYVLEDHLSTLQPNLQNGNWGSFDLPCYDAFTRP